MAEKTEAQQFAEVALDRVGKAPARSAQAKYIDIRVIDFLQQIADGKQKVVAADELERLQKLEKSVDSQNEE